MKFQKLGERIVGKAKKEGLDDEWIDYVFDLIFMHFILINPTDAESVSFKCKNCLDFESDCKEGNFPDCFIEKAKIAKKHGLKPSDLIDMNFQKTK